MTASVDRILRITFLTPANLGAAAGEASLDRPTQKAEGSALPYVPDSALKGVLAGELGDVGDKNPNSEREDLYGSPDRETAQGAASRVVFGNAELLCFPVATKDGGLASIVPAENLGRCLWLEGVTAQFLLAADLLATLEYEGEKVSTSRAGIALPVWPALPQSLGLEPMGSRIEPDGIAELTTLLARYTGRNPTVEEPFLVVPARVAARLWVHAAEVRAATALERSRRVVRDATLRTLELIPETSVFLSLVTLIGAHHQSSLQPQAQLGSGEGNGLGWAELSWVESAQTSTAEAAAAACEREESFDEANCMIALHGAVRNLADDSALWDKVDAAAGNLGGRIQYSGLEAALAFELAKAKPAHDEPGLEARAHRWLLAHALGLPLETGPKGRAETLLAHLRQGFLMPGMLERERESILTRWLWLRRYLELGAEPVKKPEEVEAP